MRFERIQFRRGPEVDVSDLTSARLLAPPEWADDEPDCLVLDFDRDLTPAEVSAVRRRLMTADGAEEQRVATLVAARTTLVGLRPSGDMATVRDALVLLLDQALDDYDE